MHHSSSSSSMTAEESTRGVAVEKLETMKKWGINTYKVSEVLPCWQIRVNPPLCLFVLWRNHGKKLWCVSSFVVVVYKTNDLRAFWSGFPDCRPGAGGPDRGAERHQKEIWERAATGQSADQPLLQHGTDAACAGRHLCWSQPEIPGATGKISKPLSSNYIHTLTVDALSWWLT